MNLRVEYFRPRNGHCLGRKGAERVTKSREVDLSCLKGFHLRFVSKKWGVAWPATCQVTFGSWMAESIGSIPTETIECMCVSPTALKEEIKFVYSVLKWLRTKILNENWRYWVDKKDQSLFESWIDNQKGDKVIYPVVKVHFRQTFCAEIVQAKTKP